MASKKKKKTKKLSAWNKKVKAVSNRPENANKSFKSIIKIAKSEYNNKGKSKRKTTTKRKSNPGRSRKGNKTNKNNNSKKKKLTIPMALTGSILVGHLSQPYPMWVAPAIGNIEALKGSQMNGSPLPNNSRLERAMQASSSGILNFTGWRTDTHKLDLDHAVGMKAEVAGMVVHEGAKYLGINRYLGQYLNRYLPINIRI